MHPRVFQFLCLASMLLLAACRMSDGPLPSEKGDVQNRIDDLNKDLGNIAAGHAEAEQDLVDDLVVFVDLEERPDAKRPIEELARQVASGIPKAPLHTDRGLQVSRQLWLTVASRELSDKQLEKLLSDVQASLVGVGVPEPRARGIAAQAREVQRQVKDRNRRWYELY